MKTFRTLLVAGVACATLTAGAASAATPIAGLFDTGVDAMGAPLPENAVDTHWLVDGATPFVYDNPSYALASDARFIAQQPGGGYTTNPNTYTLTFFLTASEAAFARISGGFEADNFATAFLNGHQIVQDVQATVFENFQQLTAFKATSGFVAGANTLSFVVTDTGPPAALLVSGLTGSVPEPAAWALMIGGFGLAGAALRRRRAMVAA